VSCSSSNIIPEIDVRNILKTISLFLPYLSERRPKGNIVTSAPIKYAENSKEEAKALWDIWSLDASSGNTGITALDNPIIRNTVAYTRNRSFFMYVHT